jgi:hypothetical protein
MNMEGKVWLLVKKYQLPKTDRKTYAFPKEQNYGDFVETRVKKSPTSPGLMNPDYYRYTYIYT